MSEGSFDTAQLILRQGQRADADAIAGLLTDFSQKKLLLARDLDDILRNADSFIVAEYAGTIVGCSTLRMYDATLYEVRSLAVHSAYQNNGIGSAMVRELVRRLAPQNVERRVFALTYRADFFRHIGFRIVSKALFPEKIWSDCRHCSKRHCCDEDAVLLTIAPQD